MRAIDNHTRRTLKVMSILLIASFVVPLSAKSGLRELYARELRRKLYHGRAEQAYLLDMPFKKAVRLLNDEASRVGLKFHARVPFSPGSEACFYEQYVPATKPSFWYLQIFPGRVKSNFRLFGDNIVTDGDRTKSTIDFVLSPAIDSAEAFETSGPLLRKLGFTYIDQRETLVSPASDKLLTREGLPPSALLRLPLNGADTSVDMVWQPKLAQLGARRIFRYRIRLYDQVECEALVCKRIAGDESNMAVDSCHFGVFPGIDYEDAAHTHTYRWKSKDHWIVAIIRKGSTCDSQAGLSWIKKELKVFAPTD